MGKQLPSPAAFEQGNPCSHLPFDILPGCVGPAGRTQVDVER
jgi:hypothetical protein